MKRFVSLLVVAIISMGVMTGCGKPKDGETPTTGKPVDKTNSSTNDKTAKASGSISVYVHQTQLILGEEKKDDKGNTYRDESTAYLKQLGEKFTEETGVKVEFVAATIEVVKPLLQVGDSSVDVFSSSGALTLDESAAYTVPYMTLDEAIDIYGEGLAKSMVGKDGNINIIAVAKNYNNAIVYNEEVIKAAGYDEIPSSLEEFEKLLRNIKTNGVIPISLHRVENWPLGTIRDFADYYEGKPGAFDSLMKYDKPFSEESPVGKNIKKYVEWKSKGYFEQEVYADFGVAMDDVSYGRSGMMLFGSWVVPQLIARVPEGKDNSIIKFDAAPDYGSGRFVTVASQEAWGINKGTDNEAGARAFIEYLAHNPEYIAKTGSIASHKDVTPIVPDMYSIIDGRIEKGEVTQIFAGPKGENYINNEEILKEANLKTDEKWAGLPFDAYDITKPDDWTKFNEQIETQNKSYKEYQKELGIEYVEE